MDFEKDESGILVPKTKPVPKFPYSRPERQYGLLEIQDEDHRKLAADGLSKLWDAMELSHWSGIRLPGQPDPKIRAAHDDMYQYVGRLLLGDDCPQKEIQT